MKQIDKKKLLELIDDFKHRKCDEVNYENRITCGLDEKGNPKPTKTTNNLILQGKRRFCGVCYICMMMSFFREEVKKM